MKAFLGTGLLGANFTKALLAKGEQVQVWNRTAAKAKALEAFGAMAFEQPEQAVTGATQIHLALKDDTTVNEVLEKALPGLQQGAIIIDHTTTSMEGAIERTKAWKEKGFAYQHAPVFMGPQNALESTGYMLVSGDQQVIATIQSDLQKMTGKLLNFGNIAGKAAALKLAGNLFLISMTAGIADMIAFGKAQAISVADIQELFSSWNPGVAAPARLKRMGTGDYSDASWELSMARKDTGLMLQAAVANGINLVTIPAIASLMDQWIARGHGNEDWTVIGKDAVG
jgi:3-hydroxyisobutyrate dehydrogenase